MQRTVREMLSDPRPIAGGAQPDSAAQLQVCRLRVTRLEADGAPDVGAGNMYVSDTLISLGSEPEVREGASFELLTGCGDDALGGYQDDDQISRLNLTMRLSKPDPELVQMLVGGTLLTDGGESIGWQYPALNTDLMQNAVSIEAWSKAIVNGSIDTALPYWRSILPLTRWRPAARTLENSPMVTELVGRGFENPNWGNGPANDVDVDTSRALNVYRDTAMPAAAVGAQAVVADAP